ncbi:MAG: metallophosphoesterase [Solobacterium sp.]|nr:metallophosphoesterase [Solobacterium sp.]
MIYVCSDIHGLYDRYEKLLKAIDFGENDTLYILGDMIDRGPDGIRILQDMMKRPNIIPFMGNHEHMMLMYLYGYDTDAWMLECNGGIETLKRFEKLSEEEKQAIIDYLDHSWIVKHLSVCGHRYSLSHIGIISGTEDMRAEFTSEDADVYDLQKRVWGMRPYEISQIRNCPEELCPTMFITGHIITRRYDYDMEEDEIIMSQFDNGCQYVDIDCGCAMGSGRGRLACVMIDEETGECDLYNALYIS